MTPELTLAGPDLRRIADVVLADLLPPRLRRLWLSRMGRMAIAQAKKNVREQKTVDGSPMVPRKRKPPKIRPVYHRDGSVTQKKTHDKMLVDLVKSRWLGMDLPDEDTARDTQRVSSLITFESCDCIAESSESAEKLNRGQVQCRMLRSPRV